MAYYKAIVWLMPATWTIASAIMVAFIVAAFMELNSTNKLIINFLYAFGYAGIIVGMSFLARYLT